MRFIHGKDKTAAVIRCRCFLYTVYNTFLDKYGRVSAMSFVNFLKILIDSVRKLLITNYIHDTPSLG